MKLTIYSDKDCTPRYNKEWPKEPNIIDYGDGEYLTPIDHYTYDMEDYQEAIQKAKDESIPYDNKQQVEDLIAKKYYDGNLMWQIQPDTFYSVDIPGKVEVVEIPHPNPDMYDVILGKVARIVAKEEKKEEAIVSPTWAILQKHLFDVDPPLKFSIRLFCVAAMEEWAEVKSESLRKENSELKKEIERLKERAEAEIAELKYKAEKWDSLDAKLAKFYEDDSEADLADIGEAAAIAFGYL